jgi:hypothetical protein
MVNQDSHVASVVLPLPLRELWPYFREPELIREWHGWEYDGLADEITEIFVDKVKISEDHRTFNFGTHLFNFFEDEGATRLEVHRAPLEEGSEWVDYVPDIDEGWTSFVQQLRFKLERHRDDSRRTLFYSGTPKDPTVAPIQWLGLGQVGLQDVGAPYGATVGPGDALTGTVWFTSKNQVGVTVDDWGDGLLIAGNGPEGGPPYTKGEAILTTYGLDDDQRDELTDRWSTWWKKHY